MSDLPEGFVLDKTQGGDLPAGFVLDKQAPAAPRAPIKTQGASMMMPEGPTAGPKSGPSSMPSAEVPDQGPAWSDVAVNALKSAPQSLYNVYVNPFVHPIDTAKAVGKLGSAFISATGHPGDFVREGDTPPTPDQLAQRQQTEAPLAAVAKHYGETYGSMKGFKNALSTDPASILADATTLAGGVGGIAGKAPGIAGQAARAVGAVGTALDPVGATANALKGVQKAAGYGVPKALGATTGAGARDITEAASAGVEGGARGKAFAENFHDNVPKTDVVDMAKSAIGDMRNERNQHYRSGMVDISKDKTVLDFGDINKAVDKAAEVGSFKGANVAPTANAVNEQLRTVIKDWETLNPNSAIFKDVPKGDLTPQNFHTPEGLDALKRTIGDLRDATKPHTPERVAADRVYNAVRGEVANQAPTYAKIMEGYGTASDKIGEVTKALSLGDKAAEDTALRKLQSASRSTVNTNFGQRAKLIDELAKYQPTLPAALAGQNLNTFAPRGLVAKLAEGGAGVGGALMAGTHIVNPLQIAGLIPYALAASPKLVGGTAYYGGRAVGETGNALNKVGVTKGRVGNAFRFGTTADRAQGAQ